MESDQIVLPKEFHTISVNKPHKSSQNNSHSPLEYIENTFQLQSHLTRENFSSPKPLFIIIVSSFNSLMKKNYGLLYQILSSFISKLSLHQSSLSYSTVPLNQYARIIYQSYDRYICLINRKFDGLLIEDSLCYLASHSKHSMIVLLFALMTVFTYITYDVDKLKTSKRETYHLLKSIKEKHLCLDMERVLCPVCSLNCIRLVNEYVVHFIKQSHGKSNSAKAGDDNEKEEEWKGKEKGNGNISETNSKSTVGDEKIGSVSHIVYLFESITSEINYLEDLIKNEKSNIEDIKGKLKLIGIKR